MVLFALLSALSFSFSHIFSKKVVSVCEPKMGIVHTSFFAALFAGLVALFFGEFSHSWKFSTFFLLFLLGIIGAVGIYSFFKSFEHLVIGETLTVASLYPFVTFALAIIFFQEYLTLVQLAVFVLVIFSSIIVVYGGKHTFSKYYIYPLLTAVAWGYFSFVMDALLKQGIHFFNVVFYLEFVILVGVLIIFKPQFKKISFVPWAPLVGAVNFLGGILFSLSLKTVDVSITSAIGSTNVVFSVILSYFIFKEKVSRLQVGGIILTVIGIALFQLLL